VAKAAWLLGRHGLAEIADALQWFASNPESPNASRRLMRALKPKEDKAAHYQTRDDMIVQAAGFYKSAANPALEVSKRWSSYVSFRWRRDQHEVECPDRHKGKVEEILFALQRLAPERDAIGERAIRSILKAAGFETERLQPLDPYKPRRSSPHEHPWRQWS
jgi:hypothetical protein